jgi:hypothetical protein
MDENCRGNAYTLKQIDTEKQLYQEEVYHIRKAVMPDGTVVDW